MSMLDEIEGRLLRNAVPDPHPVGHECRECSDARDIAALLAVVRAMAGLHVRRVPHPESGCRECGQVYPCSTMRAMDDLYDVPF
jgi:hypothetical protein